MYIYIYAYMHICVLQRPSCAPRGPDNNIISGKTDSIHHHHLKGNFETATVPELRQKPLYTTPSGWWWCIESVFRIRALLL